MRPRKKQTLFDFHIWLSAELKERIEATAERECRSISKQVEYWVRRGLVADSDSKKPLKSKGN